MTSTLKGVKSEHVKGWEEDLPLPNPAVPSGTVKTEEGEAGTLGEDTESFGEIPDELSSAAGTDPIPAGPSDEELRQHVHAETTFEEFLQLFPSKPDPTVKTKNNKRSRQRIKNYRKDKWRMLVNE